MLRNVERDYTHREFPDDPSVRSDRARIWCEAVERFDPDHKIALELSRQLRVSFSSSPSSQQPSSR